MFCIVSIYYLLQSYLNLYKIYSVPYTTQNQFEGMEFIQQDIILSRTMQLFSVSRERKKSLSFAYKYLLMVC